MPWKCTILVIFNKNFLGRGTAPSRDPSPDPSSCREGDTPSPYPNLIVACGHSSSWSAASHSRLSPVYFWTLAALYSMWHLSYHLHYNALYVVCHSVLYINVQVLQVCLCVYVNKLVIHCVSQNVTLLFFERLHEMTFNLNKVWHACGQCDTIQYLGITCWYIVAH